MGVSGPDHVGERGLRTERDTGGTLHGVERLQHQDTQGMLLVGHRRQNNPRWMIARRQTRDGLTQMGLQQFGVEMFLKYLQFATPPGLTDQHVHSWNCVQDKSLQAFAHDRLRQQLTHAGNIVSHQGFDNPVCQRISRRISRFCQGVPGLMTSTWPRA